MRQRLILAAALGVLASCSTNPSADLISRVREATAANQFVEAEHLVSSYRESHGIDPEMILAMSWIGRGAQAAERWNDALRYAAETRRLALDEIRKRPIDAEPNLPLALSAAIEVQAQATAEQGDRAGAIAFLHQELNTWRETSMRPRIQKNINLLSLEGKPAPPLQAAEFIGDEPPQSLQSLRGKPVVLFFWAHWCTDCKAQAPILARIQRDNEDTDLVVIGPTQRFGYAAGGEDASPGEEFAYIARIRRDFYGSLRMAVPVSAEDWNTYGVSSTPTLVLVARDGIVRLYHPGGMTYDQLAPLVTALIEDQKGL